MVVDPPQRGKKRSAAEHIDETPRIVEMPVDRRRLKAVVKSPDDSHRPKRRIRMNEDGQAAEPVSPGESDESPPPEGLWIGRGEVSIDKYPFCSHNLTLHLGPLS